MIATSARARPVRGGAAGASPATSCSHRERCTDKNVVCCRLRGRRARPAPRAAEMRDGGSSKNSATSLVVGQWPLAGMVAPWLPVRASRHRRPARQDRRTPADPVAGAALPSPGEGRPRRDVHARHVLPGRLQYRELSIRGRTSAPVDTAAAFGRHVCQEASDARDREKAVANSASDRHNSRPGRSDPAISNNHAAVA